MIPIKLNAESARILEFYAMCKFSQLSSRAEPTNTKGSISFALVSFPLTSLDFTSLRVCSSHPFGVAIWLAISLLSASPLPANNETAPTSDPNLGQPALRPEHSVRGAPNKDAYIRACTRTFVAASGLARVSALLSGSMALWLAAGCCRLLALGFGSNSNSNSNSNHEPRT